MKRINILLFTLLLLIGGISVSRGQNADTPIFGILYQHTKGLDGSPFMQNDWNIGNIVMNTNDVVKGQRLKYDVLKNELVYYNETFKRIFTVDPLTIKSFVLNPDRKDSIYFYKYLGEPLGYRLKKGHFVQLAYNGKINLLIRYTADISEANDIASKDKIIKKDLYFIQNGTKIDEIRPNLRSVIKLFPEQKQTLKKIASKIHFKRKSSQSLIQLVAQLDQQL